MAEQTVNSVASAVTGELISRGFSGLIQRYGNHATTSEKLQQLEMLLIKIHSAVEASEKRTIENSWLLRWRDKLKEAASQGDEVLASFPQPAKDAQATSNADANPLQAEAVSSSAAAPTTATGALSFTTNSLSTMVQGIRSATQILFSSGDNDMERLNSTLGRLQKLSPDIAEFIRLIHLEALEKVDQSPCSTALSTKVHGPTKKMRTMSEKKRMKRSTTDTTEPQRLMSVDTKIPTTTKAQKPRERSPTNTHLGPSETGPRPSPTLSFCSFAFSMLEEEKEEMVAQIDMFCDDEEDSVLVCDSAVLQKEQQFTLLQDRLKAAFTEICKAVKLADSRDLEDLKWLAYWAGILREAKEHGCDALGATSTCKTVYLKDSGQSMVECDQEKDELSSIVLRLEGLAMDVEYFSKLVYLCPAC